MFRFFLCVLAILIILSMIGYMVYLWVRLKKQKKFIQNVHKQRFLNIIESVDLIAKAMLSDQCGLSEGVLRLKPLLDVIGHKLAQYPAMWALYAVVEKMPILDERKQLKRNERMKLDLEREAKEAELEEYIKQECRQLLTALEQIKKDL